MKKIVHLITGLSNGGAEMMLFKLLSHMDSSHFANVVVSMTSKGLLGKQIEKLHIPVFALGMRPGVPGFSGLFRLIRLLQAEHPRILQTWLYHADLLGFIAGKLSGVSTIVWNVRCSDLERKDHPLHLWVTIKILSKISPWPAAVIVNSSAGQLASARLGYKPRKWEIIPNGFDLDVFKPSIEARIKIRQELGLHAATFLIGLVARFDVMKDHITFLRAAKRLHETFPDVHFVLAGEDVDNRNVALVNDVASLGLEKNVHLLGERKDIQLVTAALDIASCSSYSESFPNVMGEAMACGVPCVVTDVGDCAKVIGNTGISVPPRDSDALAMGWKTILSMTENARQALGREARDRVSSLFDINTVVRQYESFYDDISTHTS